MAQLEQAAKILPILTVLTVLIYWTGRWYTEWYYNQFSVNYNTLNLDRTSYIFASWNTVLTALALIFIVALIVVAILLRPAWLCIIFAVLLTLTALLILFRWPFEFDPQLSFGRKLLGAREFSLQLVGWVALFGTMLIMAGNWSSIAMTWAAAGVYITGHLLAVLVLVFLLTWMYLGLVGYFLAKYHGQSAIKQGRMGVKMVKVGNAWWLHVLRTPDGRNLIYDRKGRKSSFVADDKIKQSKEFVRMTEESGL